MIASKDRHTATPSRAARSVGRARPRWRIKATGGLAIKYALLIIVGLIFAVPLYWLFSGSVKPNSEIYRWPLVWIPHHFHWQHYVEAWRAAPFGHFIVNSVIVAVVGVIAKLILALTTAYAFVYLNIPGKNVLFVLLLSALMIPGNVTIIVNYLTVSSLGWINTYAGLIVPGIGSIFGTFLLRQHMMSLPRELLEAAEVDGAGHLRKLFGIITPISRPVVVTVALITLIDDWNSYIWPLIITNTASMRTLPIGVYFLKTEEGVANWGVIMAGTAILVAPMLIVFLFAQRFVISGLTQGALKA